MSEFRFQPASGRVHIRLEGFLTLEQAEEVRRQVADACRQIRSAGGALSMLADLTDYAPQSRAVNDVGADIAAAVAATRRSEYAVVTGSALQRLRLRRVLEVAQPSFFDGLDEAVAWLGWEAGWAPPGGRVAQGAFG